MERKNKIIIIFASLIAFSIIFTAKFYFFKSDVDATTGVSVEKGKTSVSKIIQVDLNNMNKTKELKVMDSDLIQGKIIENN